jgi:predicted DCC family thiol-disulfide oxidoreductase YuxK
VLTDPTGELTIFYDGGCPLCTAEIDVYRNCAGAEGLAFVDVSAHDSGLIAPGLDKSNSLKRFHVRLSDGSLVSGAAGFGHLWLALPAWHWLGRIVLLPGMLQATEAVYRSFLVFRPALQQIWRTKSLARPRQ